MKLSIGNQPHSKLEFDVSKTDLRPEEKLTLKNLLTNMLDYKINFGAAIEEFKQIGKDIDKFITIRMCNHYVESFKDMITNLPYF